eukprot:CAMPEP_0206057894 /NCGR_PEP_ID=MMETSP1466-20131121/45387_1 /ASSEMBLY_ACC=CAM_ASM_001126 /TAXON_ID=44452 /ORGANISM="Pavlova gyrans, Strain CCMP608" /LENGTH=44 /DNA_ID= /DNA_START= /DNA_END= /DNA_ORIENTATION=
MRHLVEEYGEGGAYAGDARAERRADSQAVGKVVREVRDEVEVAA